MTELVDDGRFRALFTAIDEGYCLCEIITDDAGRPVDYRFLETNPLFEEMTGLSDPVGRTAHELVPDLEPHWVEIYGKVALEREPVRFQQGSQVMGRWFDVFAMPLDPPGRFGVVFKDETDRLMAEIALRESETKYKELAEREHRVALRLQQALLPDRLETHPQLSITAHYEANDEMLEVGGDWYDTFAWPDGSLGAMVGDVVGHGLDAAAAMGRLRAGVSALSSRCGPDPVAVLAALEECVRGPGGAEFVTAACVVVDPDGRCVRYARAGHPPPLLVEPNGATRWLEDGAIPPYGREPNGEVPTTGEIDLGPGATLWLYSDGLVERRGETIDAGLERLRRLAVDLTTDEDPDLASAVASRLGRTAPWEDDVVVLAIRAVGR